jgi:adenylate cyclase
VSAGVEVERKFVVAGDPPEASVGESEMVRQGYLAIDGTTEARVRSIGERCMLTIKGGRGLRRTEEEIEIDAGRFDRLWPLTDGRRIEKVRRRVILDDGLVAEVDVYAGDLEGLVTAEVEFASEEAAGAFRAPSWLGTEVTGDDRYANRTLAVDGIPPSR